MSERELPATPRRLALARKAGAVAHAPTLTTAAAWAGMLAALTAMAPRLVASVREALRHGLAAAAPSSAPLGQLGSMSATGSTSAALSHAPISPPPSGAGAPSSISELAGLVGRSLDEALAIALAVALPVLVAGAAAALLVHLAQTRALWIPRRRVPGAPVPPADAAARARGGLWAAVRGGALLAVAAGWLVAAAPAFAASLAIAPARLLPAGAALVAAAALALTATWVALGGLELLGRALALARAARMTPEEQREELRATGGAARLWRGAHQRAGQRDREQLGDAALLVVGDGVCAAVAWHPQRTPVPAVVVARRGRGIEALLAVARAGGIPIRHRPELAAALAARGPGAVAEALWPELAKLVALSPPRG